MNNAIQTSFRCKLISSSVFNVCIYTAMKSITIQISFLYFECLLKIIMEAIKYTLLIISLKTRKFAQVALV